MKIYVAKKKLNFSSNSPPLSKIYAVNYVRKFYHVFYCVKCSFFSLKSHVVEEVRKVFPVGLTEL